MEFYLLLTPKLAPELTPTLEVQPPKVPQVEIMLCSLREFFKNPWNQNEGEALFLFGCATTFNLEQVEDK